MAVLGFLEWCRQLRAVRFAAADDPPVRPPGTAAPEEAKPTVEREPSAGGEDRTPRPATRLLLGTACGSVLLFSIAVSARVAPGPGSAALTPLTTTVLGALGAAVVTALAAGAGRTLRGRSAASRTPDVSGSPNPADEPSPQPGREHGDVP